MPKPHPPHELEHHFFVDCSPSSIRGAKCKLDSCNAMIESGRYRIAMKPAMSGPVYHAAKNAGKSAKFGLRLAGQKLMYLQTFIMSLVSKRSPTYRKPTFLTASHR